MQRKREGGERERGEGDEGETTAQASHQPGVAGIENIIGALFILRGGGA